MGQERLPINLTDLNADVVYLILLNLRIQDIRALKVTCRFFAKFDYSMWNLWFANKYLEQADKATTLQERLKCCYLASSVNDPLANIAIWTRHVGYAINQAQVTKKPYYDPTQVLELEQWASNNHPFIFVSVMSFNKAKMIGDAHTMLRVAYLTSILFNSNDHFQKDALRFFARTKQTPVQFITGMLEESEANEHIDVDTRQELQSNCVLDAASALQKLQLPSRILQVRD